MSNKSISGRNLDNALTSEELLGKPVIDSSGKTIGISEKVFIDSKNLNFLGISVDKGVLHKGIIIGKGYIDKVTSHAIFLNTTVALEVVGMSVFDSNGRKIGVVKHVTLRGIRNSIKSLEVSEGLFGKIHHISSEYISEIGENVMLSVTKFDLKPLQDARNGK
ncbi:MAG: PRC-barrel domain-containing protein [Candidatus Pacearchaeota archaeon]